MKKRTGSVFTTELLLLLVAILALTTIGLRAITRTMEAGMQAVAKDIEEQLKLPKVQEVKAVPAKKEDKIEFLVP
jgi:Tfp pilus assembly protein PilV